MGNGHVPPAVKAKRRIARPNFLLIHARELGRYIQPFRGGAPAPHLEQLANEGVLFRRAFAAALPGGPAGASLFTGKSAHVLGAVGPAVRLDARDIDSHLACRLRKAGYRPAVVGHHPFENTADELGYSETLAPRSPQASDVAAATASFLDEQREQPFFLTVGFHEISRDRRGLSWGPGHLAKHPLFRTMVAAIDEATGKILATLKDQELETSTWVIFTTDHGNLEPFLEPWLSQEDLGTALIIHEQPGQANKASVAQPGRAEEALVSQLDVVPTLLDLAGLDGTSDIEGQSLVRLLKCETASLHDVVFSEVNLAAYRPLADSYRLDAWTGVSSLVHPRVADRDRQWRDGLVAVAMVAWPEGREGQEAGSQATAGMDEADEGSAFDCRRTWTAG